MTIIIAALLIVAIISFVAAFFKRGPGDPSAVQLIALGCGLEAIALLILVLEAASKKG